MRAISALAAEIPVNPNKAATNEMTRNTKAHRNIVDVGSILLAQKLEMNAVAFRSNVSWDPGGNVGYALQEQVDPSAFLLFPRSRSAPMRAATARQIPSNAECFAQHPSSSAFAGTLLHVRNFSEDITPTSALCSVYWKLPRAARPPTV